MRWLKIAYKKGTLYRYKTGKYVREKLGSKRGCIAYRYVRVPGRKGRLVLVCIRRKKGPRGGRTKAIALLRHIKTAKGKRLTKRAKVKRMKKRKRWE